MTRRHASLLALLATISLSACGGDEDREPTGGASDASTPSPPNSLTMRCTACLVSPMLRAIQATGIGEDASATAPSTCQRALVRPRSATRRSPAASSSPFSRNTSRISSVTRASARSRSSVIVALPY